MAQAGDDTRRTRTHPAVGSIEADLAFFDDPDNAKSHEVDGAIGEDSHFHATFGYYGHRIVEWVRAQTDKAH